MSRARLTLAVAVVAVVAVAAAGAPRAQLPDPLPDDAFGLYRLAQEAASRKDTAVALDLLARAGRKAPNDPRVPYAQARLLADAGKAKEALAALRAAVDLGGGRKAGTEPAFTTLRTRPEALRLFAEIAEAARPRSRASVAFTLAEKDLIPEGITHDPKSGAFFVSSLYRRKVVRVAPDGTASDLVPEARDGLWKAVGLKVDAARRRLWVMSAVDDPGMTGFSESDLGKAGAFVFDLDSGRLVAKLVPELPAGQKAFFNDAAVAGDGDAFVTDSERGAVYRSRVARGDLVEVLPPGTLVYPNGLTLSDGGAVLFVAHAGGVMGLVLSTGERFDLAPCKGTSLVGLDGLSWHRGALVGIQNGLFPDKVLRYVLSPDRRRVVRAEVLDQAGPNYAIPTTGTVVGDDYYFIANSQLDAFEPDGRLKAAALKEVVVLKVPISPSP